MKERGLSMRPDVRDEMNVEHLDCLVQIRKLELQDYLSPDVLEIENNEYYK